MKKKLSGLLGALAAVAVGILAARGGHHSDPQPGPGLDPSPEVVAMWQRTCEAIWQEELGRPIDPEGLRGCLEESADGGTAETIRAHVQASPEYVARQERLTHPPMPTLSADGRIFRADGQPWRWLGVSAFQLLDRFAHGEDVSPFLEAYRGYRVLRVWPYVPRKDWGASAWDAPDPQTVRAFLARVAADGWFVELTLLTDDDPGRIAWAHRLVSDLSADPKPTNLLIEIGNEPTTHKRIDTPVLRAVLEGSGFLYTSGDYEESSRFFGRYLVAHTARDGEWPRKAHDLLEFFNGGGPNAPSDPAHKVPAVADEPIRPDEARGTLEEKRRDFYAYGATCALLGAGATFHSQTGKLAQLPTADERTLAAALLAGLTVFPADAALGSYRRIDERAGSLRTYVVGDRYMVRVRPTTKNPPEGEWTSRDEWGITFQRGQ